MIAKRKMFLKLIARSLSNRKRKIAVILITVIIGSTIISGLINVYYDIGQKMTREFRSYGANLVLLPRDGGYQKFIDGQTADAIQKLLSRKSLVGYAPYLFEVSNINKRPVVLVGSRFDQLPKVNPYWKIKGSWIKRSDGDRVLIGEEAAEKLGLKPGDEIELFPGKKVTVAGLIKSGGAEEKQVFVDLDVLQRMTKNSGRVNAVYVSVIGQASDLLNLADRINKQYPNVLAKPIKKIAQTEGRVLAKIRWLIFLVAAVILATTVLCVSTAMIAIAIERRYEIGLKKALGAPNSYIVAEFVGESLVIGLLGGIIGWFLGYIFAQWVGQTVFNSEISARAISVIAAIVVSVGIAVLASAVPVRIAANTEPALVLKGE